MGDECGHAGFLDGLGFAAIIIGCYVPQMFFVWLAAKYGRREPDAEVVPTTLDKG